MYLYMQPSHETTLEPICCMCLYLQCGNFLLFKVCLKNAKESRAELAANSLYILSVTNLYLAYYFFHTSMAGSYHIYYFGKNP